MADGVECAGPPNIRRVLCLVFTAEGGSRAVYKLWSLFSAGGDGGSLALAVAIEFMGWGAKWAEGVAPTPAVATQVAAVGESRVLAMLAEDLQQPERERKREREGGRGGYHGLVGGDAAFGEEAKLCREDLEAWWIENLTHYSPRMVSNGWGFLSCVLMLVVVG
ncbi:unnamed protein product [Ectocarpus sp. 12 AP-2014]